MRKMGFLFTASLLLFSTLPLLAEPDCDQKLFFALGYNLSQLRFTTRNVLRREEALRNLLDIANLVKDKNIADEMGDIVQLPLSGQSAGNLNEIGKRRMELISSIPLDSKFDYLWGVFVGQVVFESEYDPGFQNNEDYFQVFESYYDVVDQTMYRYVVELRESLDRNDTSSARRTATRIYNEYNPLGG